MVIGLKIQFFSKIKCSSLGERERGRRKVKDKAIIVQKNNGKLIILTKVDSLGKLACSFSIILKNFICI